MINLMNCRLANDDKLNLFIILGIVNKSGGCDVWCADGR